MVNIIIEKGSAAPTIAWVDGMPYSTAYSGSNATTGGEGGRGHRITSFNACPMYMMITQTRTIRLPTALSIFQNLQEIRRLIKMWRLSEALLIDF